MSGALKAAVLNAHSTYAKRRPKSAALHKAALQFLPAGNTRTVLHYAPFPTAMSRGEDCRLWDIDGMQYLDLCGEYTAGLFGHSNDMIRAALREALDRGVNLAAVGEAEVKFARIICERFPAIEKVRFTNSGTEANLMAITVARAYTGRKKVIAFRGGYHGSVLAFNAASAMPVIAPFPVVVCEYNDIHGAIEAIRSNKDDLAGVIVEPMLGAGGCIPATREFLLALREATADAGALLIFDEVMTSRMAVGGHQSRLGITPDLTTLGKYMAGGMSFGAFGGRADVMDLFAGRLPHAGTFNNNVLSMAGGCTALGELFTDHEASALFERGEDLRVRLNALCTESGLAVQYTGLGSLLTVHFRKGDITRPYVATASEDALRELYFFDMLERGIYMARRGMVALSLPVSAEHIERFVRAVERFLETRRPLFVDEG
jgi:glutamate-1-semialdehyde 2,1-aminomutase